MRRPPSAMASGVHGEVHEALLELGLVHGGVGQARPQRGLEVDVLADGAGEELLHLGDHGVQVQHHGLGHLTPREDEQLAHQVGGPARHGHDLPGVGGHLVELGVAVALAGGRHAGEDQLGVVHDPRQQVVEVVGDAPGQLPDALEAL